MEETLALPGEKKPKSFWNHLKSYFSNPSNIILVIAAMLLTLTVIVPLIFLVLNTFQVHIGEAHLGAYGSYTLQHWINILTKTCNRYAINNFWMPLLNSTLMALVACVFAVVVGGANAWFVTRSDIPCKKLISAVFVFPYMMPSWAIAMFWENLFRNTNVGTHAVGILQSMSGFCMPEWFVYGFFPCAICLGIHYAPFAYILIGGILRNMDANLEEAATILKASRFKILRRVTLPIVMPALLSTILLVFASSVSSYTVPMFLGIKGNFWTLSLKMKSLLNISQKVGEGYVIAVVLLLFSVAILLLNQYMTGKRKSYTTITGKSSQVSFVQLGWKKWIFTPLLLLYVAFFAIVPLLSFALESVTTTSGDLSTFTLYYWITSEQTNVYIPNSYGILHNAEIWKAFGNSLLLSLVVALFAGTIGLLIGYAVSKKRGSKLANFVSNVSFFPYLIPAMSFSAVYLAISCTPAFSWLFESIFLLMIVGSVKFMPFATRSDTSAMMQVSGEIEEAAITMGVPWWKRMTKIMFPIQKSSFLSGYLLPFISCMRELTLFVLISSSGLIVTAVLQNYETYDATQISNGINLIIIVTVLLINFLVNKITGASIDKGVGGN